MSPCLNPLEGAKVVPGYPLISMENVTDWMHDITNCIHLFSKPRASITAIIKGHSTRSYAFYISSFTTIFSCLPFRNLLSEWSNSLAIMMLLEINLPGITAIWLQDISTFMGGLSLLVIVLKTSL